MALRKRTVVLWVVAAIALASFARAAYFATHVDDFRSAARVTASAAEGDASGASGRAPNPDLLDRRHFTKRTVKLGIEDNGYPQILDGLEADEIVATHGVLFLTNALITATR